MRHNNIVSAIEWLPEHLFTEEIVEAAVESKEIEVLSHIPGRFLTRTYRTNHRGQHGELAQLRAAQYSGGVPFGSSL